ncbi:MAG: HU family DNA-binding protein, partial [Nocardioides sp.]
MNRTELIDALAARFEGNRAAAKHALDSVVDTITREVAKGEKVAITGFGSFEKKLRPARLVRNPRTGEKVTSKKTFVPKFTAGSELKDVVAGVKNLPKMSMDSLASLKSGRASKPVAAKVTKIAETPAASAPAPS